MTLSSAYPPVNSTNSVYGWGRTCTDCAASPTLKTATVGHRDERDRRVRRPGHRQHAISGTAWTGDSGGPQVYNGAQVGVASTADGTSVRRRQRRLQPGLDQLDRGRLTNHVGGSGVTARRSEATPAQRIGRGRVAAASGCSATIAAHPVGHRLHLGRGGADEGGPVGDQRVDLGPAQAAAGRRRPAGRTGRSSAAPFSRMASATATACSLITSCAASRPTPSPDRRDQDLGGGQERQVAVQLAGDHRRVGAELVEHGEEASGTARRWRRTRPAARPGGPPSRRRRPRSTGRRPARRPSTGSRGRSRRAR